MLLKTIKPSDICIGLKADDWRDAIRKSSKILLDQGAIEESYVDAMIEVVQNNGPYIVITKHTALAHARPECGVNKMAVSFAVLDPPINFDVEAFDPVKLIITLAATDPDSHLDLIAELADVLSNEDRLEALFNAKDAESFCAELQK